MRGAKNRNANSIGVCLIGGFGSSANDQFADNFTHEQELVLRDLIDDIKTRHPIKKVPGRVWLASRLVLANWASLFSIANPLQ